MNSSSFIFCSERGHDFWTLDYVQYIIIKWIIFKQGRVALIIYSVFWHILENYTAAGYSYIFMIIAGYIILKDVMFSVPK